MKNSPICVDASIVASLLLQSSSQVQLYWQKWTDEGRSVICPALLHFEVVNVLHHYWRHDQLPAEIVQKLIDVLHKLPLQVQTHPELHVRAAILAQQLKLGATYDAHYVALAQCYDAEFWTLDARLHRRFAEIMQIVHLVT